MSWKLASRIENEVQRVITQQEINGWKFDIDLASKHCQHLQSEIDRIYEKVSSYLVPEVIHDRATVEKPYKKSGLYTKRVEDYWKESVSCVAGPYTPVRFEPCDLGSRQKLIRQLSRFGWKPLEFTPRTEKGGGGNPKLTEESMESLRHPIGADIARQFIYRHRLSQIKGWLDSVRADGRIEARANTLGTPTARFRHSIVVNVPKASPQVIFGKEMRDLFTCEDGYVLVGHDAEGLELRLLAHYMNDEEFIEAVVNGDKEEGTDVHTLNQRKAGLPTRDLAKTFIYALLYGASDKKIGEVIGGNSRAGRELKGEFLQGYPELRNLIEKVQRASERGWIRGLDGRKIFVDSKHKALNRLIQSSGAILMKVSMIYLDKWTRQRYTLDQVRKVGDMHDEGIHEVINDSNIIGTFSDLCCLSIVRAGKYFNLNCPMAADVQVGRTWAEIH